MKYKFLKSLALSVLSFFSLSLLNVAMANPALTPPEKNLDFKVYLDSKEIGYHRVNITPTVDGEQISVEAKFDIKFLFITAFSYLHTAEETWKNECLESISTETVENGDQMFVRSEPANDGLFITTDQAQEALTGCIRSFAYWDYDRLYTTQLLNTQTGEYVPARFSSLGDVIYENEGKRIAAKQFVLEAENAKINLWYDKDDQWLALKTKVKGDRVLAYHRIMEGIDEEKT
jgi:hypothetical protein